MASGADRDAVIETIDIGGPAMVRSAAKNHDGVVVLTDPADYPALIEELGEGAATGEPFRRRMAAKAFAHTAAYDAAIAGWFAFADQGQTLPETLTIAAAKAADLRYGENPHQSAALYIPQGPVARGVAQAEVVQGKALSYNNLADADAALGLVAEFRDGPPACVIVKHANPCGVAQADTLAESYRAAFQCDSVSAFGGIVAVNRPLDEATARAVTEIFTEVVVAPDADEAARAVFAAKKNLRLLLTGELPDPARPGLEVRSIAGGLLVQSRDAGGGGGLAGGDEARPHGSGSGRRPLRLDGGAARQVERHRLRQGRGHGGDRRGPDEPPRLRPHRRGQGARGGGDLRLGRVAHGRLGGGVRRLLPLRRRADRGGGGRRHLYHPARRLDARRGGHRGRRRTRAGDGVHRGEALPALRGG